MNPQKLKMSSMYLKIYLYFFLLIPCLVFGIQKKIVVHQGVELSYQPWFTGPLLTPTSINMEPGHPAIEPSVTIFWNYGNYSNDWELKKENRSVTINPYVDFQFAITKRTGIELQVQSFTTIRNGESTTGYADTNILFGYQVSDDQKNSWVPDFRFLLEIIFPSGKYDKLDPKKDFNDATGQGAFFIGPNLAFQKLFYLPRNFFILQWAVGYFFPSRTTVKGFNLYGGGKGTKGKIRPGKFLTAFISGEYSLSQRWVIGFESEFFYQFPSSKFEGTTGIQLDGLLASIGKPSSSQLIVLPELQYNFNAHSGLLMGGWFSLIGKNTKAFAAGFIGYLYIF